MTPEENASTLAELKALLGVVITLLFLSLLGFSSSGVRMVGGVSVSGAAPPPVAVAGTEYRCTELGANCICSEPMQADIAVSNGVDFPDSPDSTECQGNWFGIGGDGNGEMISVSGEAGWGDAQWAYNHGWNNGADKNQNNWLLPTVPNEVPFTAENRSWCVRYYRQVDDEYYTAGADATTCLEGGTVRNKMIQSMHGGYVFHVQEDTGGPCRVNPSKDIVAGWSGGTIPSGSLGITLDSCVDAPCRFELCVDGPLLTGVTDITWRARVVSLEPGGPTGLFTRTQDAGASEGIWGGDINHSGSFESSVGGSREAYFMGALWDDVDANRWIGAACEIEGGCP